MLRAGAHVGEAEFAEKIRDRPFAINNAKALFDYLLQVDPPPPHNTVHRRIRTGFDDRAKRLHLGVIEIACPARCLAVGQAIGSLIIEAVHPVTQCLTIHTANPGSLRTGHAVIHRCKREQATALLRVATTPGKMADTRGIKI